MLLIGEALCNISIAPLSQAELAGYAELLFDEIDVAAERFVHLPDYELHLEVEEGSVKARNAILVSLASLYVGIGNYGSFVSGVREIRDQVKAIGDLFLDAAPGRLSVPKEAIVQKKRNPAVLGKLENLFQSVAKGDMSPDDAARLAMDVLADDEEPPPALSEEVAHAMANIRRNPQQLPFVSNGYDLDTSLVTANELPLTRQRKPRQKREMPPVLPSNKLRVEVWREGKHGKKNIKIVSF